MTVPRLLVLTDRRQLPDGRGLVDTVARCAEAGATTVVLRELDLCEDERAELAVALVARVQVVSARTALASACGVHLASHQPISDAGSLFHGRSCHGPDGVARAVGEGASWVTVSPVAQTPSKPGYGPPLGTDGVRRAVAAAGGTPVYALGGVEVATVASLRAAGAHGVAVMGAVMRAADPAAVVSGFLAELGV
ncbi:MAG: thiamine monophosphate synthase [Marmoricola sp.]|nr:thiamine monophosphate synthase [Marmoricola sp.]